MATLLLCIDNIIQSNQQFIIDQLWSLVDKLLISRCSFHKISTQMPCFSCQTNHLKRRCVASQTEGGQCSSTSTMFNKTSTKLKNTNWRPDSLIRFNLKRWKHQKGGQIAGKNLAEQQHLVWKTPTSQNSKMTRFLLLHESQSNSYSHSC